MKKGLFYISFISLLILFWAGTALAISAPNLIAPEDGIKLPLGSEVTLKWSAVSDANKGYHYYVSDTAGNKYREQDNYKNTEATLQLPRISSGTFKWKVRACQTRWWFGTKCGEWSPEWSIVLGQPTTPAPAPGPAPVSKPIITSVDPIKGAVGTIVTITGENFDSTCSFNSIKFEQVESSGNGEIISFKPDSCSENSVTRRVPTFSGTSQNIKISVWGNRVYGESNSLDFLIEGPPSGAAPPDTAPPATPQGKLQVAWPKTPLGTPLQGDSLTNLVQYLYEWGISLGGFAAFVVLIMAGVQYLTSAGDAGKMKDAIDKIRNAVIGLVMLFASVLILNTINPQLTQLRMPPVKPESTSVEIAINLKDFQFNSCVGAELYSAADYQPEPSFELKTFNCINSQINYPRTVGSIKIIDKGLCLVKLYPRTGCQENDQTITIASDTPDISAILGTTKFNSIKLINLYKK